MKPRPPAVAVTAEPWRRWVGYGPDGARRMIANVEEACRIRTYGDSFTHGDRVNDGGLGRSRSRHGSVSRSTILVWGLLGLSSLSSAAPRRGATQHAVPRLQHVAR
jgi:hypothetical protein